MAIYKLKPVFKDYIWGGSRLKDEFGKISDLEKIAESWALSCHEDGQSMIDGGEFDGVSLCDLINMHGKSMLGTACERFDDFPILIKLIDARDDLSVQVHPDNEYAQRCEGEQGKTEMWYVADCDKGSRILYGFEREISKEEFESRIEDETLPEAAHSVYVKKGDVFFIEAGTLHAIGKGILMVEIQQNSNTTYRIYDYGRLGNNGKPRELHVEKAKDVTVLAPARPVCEFAIERKDGYTVKPLSKCEYFAVSKVDVADKAILEANESSFQSLLFLDGEGSIIADDVLSFKKGDSIFIAAGTGKYAVDGKCSFILTEVD